MKKTYKDPVFYLFLVAFSNLDSYQRVSRAIRYDKVTTQADFSRMLTLAKKSRKWDYLFISRAAYPSTHENPDSFFLSRVQVSPEEKKFLKHYYQNDTFDTPLSETFTYDEYNRLVPCFDRPVKLESVPLALQAVRVIQDFYLNKSQLGFTVGDLRLSLQLPPYYAAVKKNNKKSPRWFLDR